VHILNDDHYPANGQILGLTDGVPIDPNCTDGSRFRPTPEKDKNFKLWTSGATEKSRKRIPAVIGRADVYYVSETFRQLVEDMEPGQHQFFPYALRNGKRGQLTDEPYYIFNITHRVQALSVPEERKAEVFRGPSKYVPYPRILPFAIHYNQNDVYSLRGVEVEGLHLWQEPVVSGGFFVSEAFLAEFDARKLKCLERVHVPEV
jgi:hypothetical protein